MARHIFPIGTPREVVKLQVWHSLFPVQSLPFRSPVLPASGILTVWQKNSAG
ncbi:Uncharacterized protein dnm_055380 [Desulfonema magnum]|uniref:Uncharacterized protein n=1 Tax=Desulfonema magnum TaxID=45655 RepID=A0A975BPT8_9BACT|nr:Uncharacterized protein dnm_055380 [Desulfonema magnum]